MRTIRSLRAAGFAQSVHLFAEPDAPEVGSEPNTVFLRNQEQLGCYRNWKRALQWLVENTAADWMLLVQDDVVWRSDASDRIHQAIHCPALQEVGFLSPYTSPAMVPRFGRPAEGWIEARFPNWGYWGYWGVRCFWGALALCLPRTSALALLACPVFKHHAHPRKLDSVVGRSFRELGKSCKVHVPSLADHIGEVSTLGRDGIKRNQWARCGYKFRPVP